MLRAPQRINMLGMNIYFCRLFSRKKNKNWRYAVKSYGRYRFFCIGSMKEIDYIFHGWSYSVGWYPGPATILKKLDEIPTFVSIHATD